MITLVLVQTFDAMGKYHWHYSSSILSPTSRTSTQVQVVLSAAQILVFGVLTIKNNSRDNGDL